MCMVYIDFVYIAYSYTRCARYYDYDYELPTTTTKLWVLSLGHAVSSKVVARGVGFQIDRIVSLY